MAEWPPAAGGSGRSQLAAAGVATEAVDQPGAGSEAVALLSSPLAKASLFPARVCRSPVEG